MSYRQDRAYGEHFIPLVRTIVGSHLLAPAPLEIDQKQATDLIVLVAKPIDIGVRIRRPGYLERWPNDFTIRSKRDSGAETELEKVKRGWMHWMFYGHGCAESEVETAWLRQWFLIDMRIWRRSIRLSGSWDEAIRQQLIIVRSNNGDGTHFIACDVRNIPPELLIDASVGIQQELGYDG